MVTSYCCVLLVSCLLVLIDLPTSGFAASTAESSSVAASTCSTNDITALNYALTLEHLEANFYRTFQSRYSATDFGTAGYDASVYPNFVLIAAHEQAHVDALQSTITGRSGVAVPACEYNFSSINSVRDYVTIAKLLENTGVSAYDGAINTISDAGLKQIAATIATVEARHAGYLNQLSNQVAFPDTLDTAVAPNDIVAAVMATGFIQSCSYPLAGPIVLFPTANYTVGAPTPMNGTTPITLTAEQAANDIKTLNYALALEHLESFFYKKFTTQFSRDDFRAASFSDNVYENFFLIAAHEKAHVDALTTTITAKGGSPVPECVYNFSSVTNVTQYISVAKVLENTGVSAYDGAINTLTDTGLQQVAATIATVEARHATFINGLADVPLFVGNFDIAIAPADVIQAVLSAGFISSCPYDFSLPTILANRNCGATGTAGEATTSTGSAPGLSTSSSGIQFSSTGLKISSTGLKISSTGTNTASTGTNTASTGTNTAPTGTNTASTGTNTASTGTNTAPTGTNTAPTGTNTAPTGTNTAPIGSNTASTGTNTNGQNSRNAASNLGANIINLSTVALAAFVATQLW